MGWTRIARLTAYVEHRRRFKSELPLLPARRRVVFARSDEPRTHTASICLDMTVISINELEAAINYWRGRSPSKGDELALCKEASALSRPYALLIVQRESSIESDRLDADARSAWETYMRLNNGIRS
jgi:hypothetical protein